MTDYPNLWKRGEIQKRVRERANHRCEECGIEFEEGKNVAKDVIRADGQKMQGGAHHIDLDRANCSMNNLVYLCQSCHFKIHVNGHWTPDKPIPKRWKPTPPQWVRDRFPHLNVIQLELWEKKS